mmetsp:Transcript_24038/g.52051  ORF Transcript_24038/g.52051 Transcript_24038/m.52051 type:complete len:392 (+) Transcript_24038:240-1415(+)
MTMTDERGSKTVDDGCSRPTPCTRTSSTNSHDVSSSSADSYHRLSVAHLLVASVLFLGALLAVNEHTHSYSRSDTAGSSDNAATIRRRTTMRTNNLKRRMKKHAHRNDEPVHLLYSSDERSLSGVEASIRSVIAHASEDVVFHFVGDRPLDRMPFVKFYNIAEVVDKYAVADFVNTHHRHNGNDREGINLNQNLPNYVRFVMDDLLPDVKKAVWIDSDTIVKCDVVELVRNVLLDDGNNDDYVLAAVPVFTPPTGLYEEDRNGDPFPDWGIEISFNAGVYVVHLDRWREQNVSDKIRDLALRNRKYRYYQMGSQPPLVLTIGEKFEQLPLSWNVKMKTVDERDDMSVEDACVLHWSGPLKPWDGNGKHLEEWLPYHVKSVEESSDEEEDEQ